jgi:hypothetical protein
MTCDKCGAELTIGAWPWCPHQDAHGFGDAPLEPYFDEHISASGEYITSRGQRRAIMSKNHLDYHDVSRKKRGKTYFCLGG